MIFRGEPMNKLEQARTQIDAIDREMAKLYEARLDAVKDVIAYKIENDLPILDSGREQVVIEKNLQFIQNPDYKEYYESFYKVHYERIEGLSKNVAVS